MSVIINANTSWSDEQKVIVGFLSSAISRQIKLFQQMETSQEEEHQRDLRKHIAKFVNEQLELYGSALRNIDNRPKLTYSPEQPDVYFPYAALGLLEEIIAVYQTGTDIDADILKMLKDAV